jgi:hypothetical protein
VKEQHTKAIFFILAGMLDGQRSNGMYIMYSQAPVHQQHLVSSSVGKFVGFKSIMYKMQQSGKTVVKLEIWVDPNNNNGWQKVYDFTDSGGWGDAGGVCGGAPDQIITWGGPIATFRWDNANDVSIKNFSVREIVPPLQAHI